MTENDHSEERVAATQLVRRVGDGDRQAESEMIERYSRGLRFLLRRQTRDPELAEDLLQETWMVALERIRSESLESPERLAGFLSGVARHLALNEMRKTSRQRTTPNSSIVDLIPDESDNPVRLASRSEVRQLVKRLIGELGQERDREILSCFYVQEQEKESICRRLGIDSAHFNRVLFRARQRMRELVLRKGARDRLRVVN